MHEVYYIEEHKVGFWDWLWTALFVGPAVIILCLLALPFYLITGNTEAVSRTLETLGHTLLNVIFACFVIAVIGGIIAAILYH